MNNKIEYYSVGALLYSPANNIKIAEQIAEERFGKKYSIALCLEDTIDDSMVEDAEKKLVASMEKLYGYAQNRSFYLPKIFIRVRRSGQINDFYKRLGAAAELLTGFIFPKFSTENANGYIDAFTSLNTAGKRIYMMPIFENSSMVNKLDRLNILYELKNTLDLTEESVLNIRVGGNDLCNYFGFRRDKNESIYDISPIADILTDLMTVYGRDYVVSGPVWEYYNGIGWDTGMMNELKIDRRNGFVGKTVIHPNQIEPVNTAYRVLRSDYEDAKAIINWNKKNLVAGSEKSERMNEYKTHYRWAKKIILLSEYYGIVEDTQRYTIAAY